MANLKRTISIFILCVVSFVSVRFFVKSSKIKDESTLVVGMMSGWAPYMSINQKGEFEGFDVDVAKLVAEKLGKKLVVSDMGSLAPLLISLNQGKIDLLFSGLDITKDRLRKLDFVRYSGENLTIFDLLFWNKIPDGVTAISDLTKLKNNVVCFEPGSTSEKFLAQTKFDGIVRKPISSIVDMIMELKYGRSVAAILEPPIARSLIKKNPKIKSMQVVISDEFQILGIGIGLKKNNDELKKQVAKVIDELRACGVLGQLEKKWNVAGETR